ncbi:MAG: TetR/AcrR family transcriptional regulator [Actinobacteria bacterium]|nr:TetR/AcrR family transcriptional regulator [Actinomycetota bacterium]
MSPPRETAAGPDKGTGPAVDARVTRTRQDILRTTLEVLTSQGLDGLTHPHLAEVAGYSRATLYNHWPNRTALLRDAFTWRGAGEHSQPGGDLRADLIAELTMFRTEMQRHGLDRALAVLAAVTAFTPELADVRDALVTDGERVNRALLAQVFQGDELDAAVLMLTGMVINSAVVHGQLPSDDLIAAAVDLVLRGRTGRRLDAPAGDEDRLQ